MMTFRKKEKSDVETLENTVYKRKPWRDVLARLISNRLGMVGLIMVLALIILVIFAEKFSAFPYNGQNILRRFTYPNRTHLLGTDNFGRDLWARLLYGGRVSLLVALLSTAISISIGTLLGSTSGYFGGKYETFIMRGLDIVMGIPSLLLAIAISAMLGNGTVNTAIAISISAIPGASRIMRSSVISIKGNEFVEAARATGSRHRRVIIKHILPNVVAPILVHSTLSISTKILTISSLSFIGLGVQPPIPEWGSILSAGRPYMRDFWPMTIFPGLFIMFTLFGFNLLGDALRDALDPKLKK